MRQWITGLGVVVRVAINLQDPNNGVNPIPNPIPNAGANPIPNDDANPPNAGDGADNED